MDVLEQLEEKEEEARKKNFIKVRKALAKREGNYNQGSDSEDESETDTEEERQRLEAEKLKNVKKEEDAADGKTSRIPSGANYTFRSKGEDRHSQRSREETFKETTRLAKHV